MTEIDMKDKKREPKVIPLIAESGQFHVFKENQIIYLIYNLIPNCAQLLDSHLHDSS
jgi:hypothetical protein